MIDNINNECKVYGDIEKKKKMKRGRSVIRATLKYGLSVEITCSPQNAKR